MRKGTITLATILTTAILVGCGNTMAGNSVSDENVSQNMVELEPTIEVTKIIEQPTEEPEVDITQIPESDATESPIENGQKVTPTPQEVKNTTEPKKETITPEPIASDNDANVASSDPVALEEGEASDNGDSGEADNYVGVYKDYDNDEENLWISKNEDGTYHIEIGIFRLTTFDDCTGTLTDKGLEFTTIAPDGTNMKGIISIDDKIVTVTFTDSAWALIESGQAFQYHR